MAKFTDHIIATAHIMPLFACFAIQPRVRLCDRCTELPLSCPGLHKLYARKINYKSSRTRMCATAPPLPLNAFDAVMMGFRLRSRARESVLPSRSRRVFELSVCGKLASLDNAQTNAADANRPTHNWGDAVRNRLMPGRLATHNVRSSASQRRRPISYPDKYTASSAPSRYTLHNDFN